MFLALLHTLETGDDGLDSYVKQLTGDRSELMRALRRTCLDADKGLDDAERQTIVTITSTAEQIFFLLSKLSKECIESRTSPSPRIAEGAGAG